MARSSDCRFRALDPSSSLCFQFSFEETYDAFDSTLDARCTHTHRPIACAVRPLTRLAVYLVEERIDLPVSGRDDLRMLRSVGHDRFYRARSGYVAELAGGRTQHVSCTITW